MDDQMIQRNILQISASQTEQFNARHETFGAASGLKKEGCSEFLCLN